VAPSLGFVGWFYGEPDGTRIGPLTTEELVNLIEAGYIQPDQWVWRAWQDRLGTHYHPTLARAARQTSESSESRG
jgi:hypothetical protein